MSKSKNNKDRFRNNYYDDEEYTSSKKKIKENQERRKNRQLKNRIRSKNVQELSDDDD